MSSEENRPERRWVPERERVDAPVPSGDESERSSRRHQRIKGLGLYERAVGHDYHGAVLSTRIRERERDSRRMARAVIHQHVDAAPPGARIGRHE